MTKTISGKNGKMIMPSGCTQRIVVALSVLVDKSFPDKKVVLMMNKQEMVFALKKNTENSFTTRKRLMDYTGYIDAKSVDLYLYNLGHLCRKNPNYYIPDVCNSIVDTRTWRWFYGS